MVKTRALPDNVKAKRAFHLKNLTKTECLPMKPAKFLKVIAISTDKLERVILTLANNEKLIIQRLNDKQSALRCVGSINPNILDLHTVYGNETKLELEAGEQSLFGE